MTFDTSIKSLSLYTYFHNDLVLRAIELTDYHYRDNYKYRFRKQPKEYTRLKFLVRKYCEWSVNTRWYPREQLVFKQEYYMQRFSHKLVDKFIKAHNDLILVMQREDLESIEAEARYRNAM